MFGCLTLLTRDPGLAVWILCSMLPSAWYFWYLQGFYVKTSREVKVSLREKTVFVGRRLLLQRGLLLFISDSTDFCRLRVGQEPCGCSYQVHLWYIVASSMVLYLDGLYQERCALLCRIVTCGPIPAKYDLVRKLEIHVPVLPALPCPSSHSLWHLQCLS